MKLAGFLLLPAGCFISVSAVVLLHTLAAQTVFCLAGVAIQIVGFVFIAREHLPKRRLKGLNAKELE
jgi:hypothetical protein